MKNLKDYTVLYAEDESIIRLNLSKQLQKYFKKVLVAKDGMEALSLYKKEQVDVLILDIQMPYLSGLDLARKVRDSDETVLIIMLTAHTESHLLLEAVELKLTKYLVKPIGKKDFEEALKLISAELENKSEKFFILSENYYWQKESQELFYDNKKLLLTVRQTILLDLLIKNHRKSVSHEEIMAIVWEDKFMEEISIESVKSLITNLRKKIPKKLIRSIYGKGYMLS